MSLDNLIIKYRCNIILNLVEKENFPDNIIIMDSIRITDNLFIIRYRYDLNNRDGFKSDNIYLSLEDILDLNKLYEVILFSIREKIK